MRRYGSEANVRWEGFEHRPGDIVISTRSKCGTTWVQMLCALLVFQRPELPAPLAEISPWLDWDVEPLEQVRARLAAQQHRRIIKTHTPLDGLPLDGEVTYLVVGRDPLDVAVSLYHHARNIDRERVAELTRRPPGTGPQGSFDEWLPRWIDPGVPVDEQLDTLPGLLHHLGDAWGRRREPNVVLLHHQELLDDTTGQLRALAARLGIDVPPDRWPSLAVAASFDAMRANAAWLAPDRLGVLREPEAFFRSGRPGEGAAAMTDGSLARYRERLDELAPPDLQAWLLR